ncbi:hypothetical protein F444_07138 [Phytophthora nicotianae P1976]|uniref:Uncharacterized protein n=1 Tax=Phytophthora nicotianae P1976 TaxID=1317066 RepID=A0A081AFN6_PHYNI|nr:hypothetical protein F444_07138 [Phytophthora nicotianae P1976]
MQSGDKYAALIRNWKRDICVAIEQVQAISRNEKNLLQLNLETHHLPFQPSPVLMRLLQNDRRRRSSGGLRSATKQQLKSADYLDRKVKFSFFLLLSSMKLIFYQFESEIRQHYEVENGHSCGKWKRFHSRASEARHQLASGIEGNFRQFCRQMGISCDELQPKEQKQDKDNQQHECTPSSLPAVTMSLEDSLRFHLAQEWVHQERFNIQEAFTNQTKKLQEDLDAFVEQLETEFLEERQKALSALTQQPENELVARKRHRHKTSSQFQSSAMRGMLLQTAPLLPVEPTDTEERVVPWRGVTAGSRVRSSSRRIRNDVDETQDKMDELQRHLQLHTEVRST